jgi:hypothetical protein
VIGSGEQALYFAERCLAVSSNADLKPFYVAYAYEAKARAQIILNQIDQAEESILLAHKFTSLVMDVESKKLLNDNLEELIVKGIALK